jgi:hypothetical protein
VLIDQSAPDPSDEAVLRESREHPERFADLFDAYHGEIVDPATHLILASNYSAILTEGDSTRPIKEQRLVILEAQWTDERPKAPTS